MARARTVREALLRKQDMSKALKVGCRNAAGQCGQPQGKQGFPGTQDSGEGRGFQSGVMVPAQRGREALSWHSSPSPGPRALESAFRDPWLLHGQGMQVGPAREQLASPNTNQASPVRAERSLSRVFCHLRPKKPENQHLVLFYGRCFKTF